MVDLGPPLASTSSGGAKGGIRVGDRLRNRAPIVTLYDLKVWLDTPLVPK